jgi:glutamate-1-semialdehyde 2,1-aminomutase
MKNIHEYHFKIANQFIPGGVNSPVRAWKAVGGKTPVFVRGATGSKILDISGKKYIDYVLSWGPMILGHSHPQVIASIKNAAEKGTSFGAPTPAETKMAELISSAIPSIEQIRMTSSGTEAVMTAIRLARGFTGKNMILKFDGCYHGHSDSVLVQSGSGVVTLGTSGFSGVPAQIAQLTLSLPYNDIDTFEKMIKRYGSRLAAVIVEPIAGNMGVVLPHPHFLKMIRQITTAKDIILIFDEVITGFRFKFGGYQNLVGLQPDLTCLGKIIGGGLPVGAVGGKRKIMKKLSPSGNIYQAGTLSGNPLAMNAGITTLNLLQRKKQAYPWLNDATQKLCTHIRNLFQEKGIPVCINQAYSMFTIFFQEGPVDDLKSAQKSDTKLFARFFHGMLKNGIWLPPSQFESLFLSFAHTQEDFDKTLEACAKTLKKL